MEIIEILREASRQVYENVKDLAGTSDAAGDYGRGAGGDISRKIDIVAEKTVLDYFKKINFECVVLGEECGRVELSSQPKGFVIMDAIDGSANAVRGVPFFCCSLAFATDDKISSITDGVVTDLTSGDMYWASKGKGAFLNENKIHVIDKDPIYRIVGINISGASPELVQRLQPVFKSQNHTRHFGANALEMAMFARGLFDIFIDLRPYYNKETGKVTEFRGTDPVSTWLSTAADIYNLGLMVHDYDVEDKVIDDIGTLINHTLFTMAANLSNKTFLRGMQDAIKVLEKQTGDATEKWLKSQSTKFIPLGALSEQVAGLFHDQQIEIYDAMDIIYSRIHQSKATPRYDAYGDALLKDTRVGVASAFRQTDIKTDPADYAFMDTGAKLTRIKPKQTVQGIEVKLSKEEYMQMNKHLAALPMRDAIRNVYEGMKGSVPDKLVAEKLTSVVSTFRRAALYQTLGENPETLAKFTGEIDKWVESLNTDTPQLNPDIAYTTSHRVLQELMKR